MASRVIILALALAASAFAGCAQQDDESEAAEGYQQMGFDGETWPRLDGVTLTILDHGAFGAFEDAKSLFENLTGATVVHTPADDAGSALNLAVQQKGDPTFDVIYGIDNILFARAVEADIFEAYKPLLADRVASDHVFFDGGDAWPATPVDHGYIGINYDPREVEVASLDDLAVHADQFVTQDPRTSTPGLGFLLATIATYGEGDADGWKSYWQRLFDGGVLVTSGWTEAYEQHFSAGYGVDYGGAGDKPIVTSYTTSPAYEAYFGRDAEALAQALVAPESTFHQIETMGIAKGTKNLAAAQAWIEFTLTDDFQALLAPGMAVYPVVADVSVAETFGDVAPAPGSFEPADLGYETIGANVEGWVQEWVALCEAAGCA